MRKTTGLSLLLLIFLSLCLIIFSLLSLSGASADKTLSQKSADRTKEYYAAVSEANRILAEIDFLLAEELQNAEHAESHTSVSVSEVYLNNCMEALQTHFPDCLNVTDETLQLTVSVPVADSQNLQIVLSIKYPFSSEDTLYQITGWNVVNTDTWTPDLSQKLYIP